MRPMTQTRPPSTPVVITSTIPVVYFTIASCVSETRKVSAVTRSGEGCTHPPDSPHASPLTSLNPSQLTCLPQHPFPSHPTPPYSAHLFPLTQPNSPTHPISCPAQAPQPCPPLPTLPLTSVFRLTTLVHTYPTFPTNLTPPHTVYKRQGLLQRKVQAQRGPKISLFHHAQRDACSGRRA